MYPKEYWESIKNIPDGEFCGSCRDCGVSPGEPHVAGCDIERCSWCGYQWIACGHGRIRKHDPYFSRWTGFYPGSLEAKALGIDLNKFYSKQYNRTFFRHPKKNDGK